MRRRLSWAVGLLALILLLGACGLSDPTQSSLDPAGPTARAEKNLFVPVFFVAVGVFIVVEGAIVLILIRFRHRKGTDRIPPQTHGNTRLEVGWTILPAVVLVFVMVPTVAEIWNLARRPGPEALNVTVVGRQWWWGFEYTDDDMKVGYSDDPIRVADVLVIPTKRDVYLTLTSAGGGAKDRNGVSDFEVIHSFWVPRLAGKQDVVPGRENHILLSADQPGTYTGQCAEFCGLQHGRMKFRVVALADADWDAWVANHKRPAAEPTDPMARAGMDLFLNPLSAGRGSCVACHAIGGTEATTNVAPNLTHFADPTHECFAGCNWETTDEDALRAWLEDPDAVKLGAKMPDYGLSDEEIDQLVAYLTTLK